MNKKKIFIILVLLIVLVLALVITLKNRNNNLEPKTEFPIGDLPVEFMSEEEKISLGIAGEERIQVLLRNPEDGQILSYRVISSDEDIMTNKDQYLKDMETLYIEKIEPGIVLPLTLEWMTAEEKESFNLSPDLRVQVLERDLSTNEIINYKVISYDNDIETTYRYVEPVEEVIELNQNIGSPDIGLDSTLSAPEEFLEE